MHRERACLFSHLQQSAVTDIAASQLSTPMYIASDIKVYQYTHIHIFM